MPESFYPFAIQPPTSNPNVFPYDLVIEETFPGIVFYPTEPSGVYTVVREVNGCLWFVNNADWDPNTLRWTQESPTNPNLPAYALELCADGNFNRYSAIPTLVPGDPITWQLLLNIDGRGYLNSIPLTVTASGPGQNQLTVTWNAGIATQVEARRVVVTDNSSDPSSLLDNLVVNGNSKWAIRKDGVLVAGQIPFSHITGFPSTFNNATFTGTSTFNGPVVMNNGLTVTGGETVDTLTATGPINVNGITTTGEVVNGNEVINGNLNVTGTTTTNNLTATGTVSLPPSAFPVDSIAGTGGVVVSNVGNAYTVDGSNFTENIDSPDGSVGVTYTGQNAHLKVVSAPVAPGSWFIDTAFFGFGSTSGVITLNTLPGTLSDTYRIVCWGSLQFQNASKQLTLAGVVAANITWDVASQNYDNSNSGSFPFMYFGTAKGGTSPSINWSCNDVIAFTPMFVTIAAGIQL